MLSVTNTYVSTCVIKCNPVHYPPPPSLSHFAEPRGRCDHEDPMSTMQPSQEDRRDDWQREDWPGLSPSRQQQTAIADDSGAGRGPSDDAETGAARSTPRTPGRRGALRGFGRGCGSPGSQRDDAGCVCKLLCFFMFDDSGIVKLEELGKHTHTHTHTRR